MVDLIELHKHFILKHLFEGEVAVDFTMGNGNDTLFLSKTVGEEGRVYAFDIQEEALLSTRRHLEENGAPNNYTLICASHHRVREFVKEPIKAGMFNLGYLPRSGKKGVTTMRETTMPAVEAAIDMLSPDGVLLIAIYPGHEEGELEGEMLREYFKDTSRFYICPSEFRILNSQASPYFFLVEKSKRAPMPTL
ncbi:MAG: methyltransferase domain-containing protein [Ruminococcaceae bacterium]|nr:methyltransferase domain-containing protein [Oscillospiraceae bacterium]